MLSPHIHRQYREIISFCSFTGKAGGVFVPLHLQRQGIILVPSHLQARQGNLLVYSHLQARQGKVFVPSHSLGEGIVLVLSHIQARRDVLVPHIYKPGTGGVLVSHIYNQ